MPVWGSLYFQNACSPVMEQVIFFHDHVMVVLMLVIILVGYVLMTSVLFKVFNRGIKEGQELEMLWTVLPALFLVIIALPSLKLLYLMEELDDPDLTVSVVGRQWYWEYEYADMDLSGFESYMVPLEDGVVFRLLEVDNSLLLPIDVGVRMMVTSGDVIHSWTVPVLGISADGIPGRLNQVLLMMVRSGEYVGQCSEICGANHSFMPVVVTGVSMSDFFSQMD